MKVILIFILISGSVLKAQISNLKLNQVLGLMNLLDSDTSNIAVKFINKKISQQKRFNCTSIKFDSVSTVKLGKLESLNVINPSSIKDFENRVIEIIKLDTTKLIVLLSDSIIEKYGKKISDFGLVRSPYQTHFLIVYPNQKKFILQFLWGESLDCFVYGWDYKHY